MVGCWTGKGTTRGHRETGDLRRTRTEEQEEEGVDRSAD